MSSHPQSRAVGSYVVGALRELEREEFVQHVRTCDECRAEVDRLAVLPELLALVPAEVAAALAADTEAPSSAVRDGDRRRTPAPLSDDVPSSVLGTVLRVAHEEEHAGHRRRRRRVVAALALAAVLVLGVAVAGQVLPVPWVGEPTGPTAGPTGEPDARTVALDAVGDVVVPVTASVALESVPWGTRIELTCTYEASGRYARGLDYVLVVRDAQGRTEQVASWTAVPGAVATVPAATAVRLGEIVEVVMVTPDGVPVLSGRV